MSYNSTQLVQDEVAATAKSATGFFANPVHWYALIWGGAVVLVLLIAIFIVVSCCCCYCKKKKSVGDGGEARQQLLQEPASDYDMESHRKGIWYYLRRCCSKYCCCCRLSPREARDLAREQQEREEAVVSGEVVKEFGEQRKERYLIKHDPLPDLGSRLQKRWFQGQFRNTSRVMVTEAPLTRHCGLVLSKETLELINNVKGFLYTVRQHPYILPMHEIHYDPHVAKLLTVQPLITWGSLRDYIYKEDPLLDWSKKYMSSSQARYMPPDQISLFGRQILEAVIFLRHKVGFPSLGHIHTGNIFVTTDQHCRLGGYDNALLSYRTRIYRSCEGERLLKSIDMIMFGHVMYEMGSRHELGTLLPTEEDFDAVKDAEVRNIVRYIFERPKQHHFKSVLNEKFFMGSPSPLPIPSIDVPRDVKNLVRDATRGHPRRQETPRPTQHEMQKSKQTVAQEKNKQASHDVFEMQNLVAMTPKSLFFHDTVDDFMTATEKYDIASPIGHLPGIGRRDGKYWTKIKYYPSNGSYGRKRGEDYILSICEVPESCPISHWSDAMPAINTFLARIKGHPYLHSPRELKYLKKEVKTVLLIYQLLEKGSLRDRIQSTRCLTNWTAKLQDGSGHSLPSKVALYGGQILSALMFLYEQGFPPLGQVHTGNLFVGMDDEGKEVCRLGGYENTLLGCVTNQNVFMYQKYDDSIDLRMFGHVVYEMSSGQELVELDRELPEDYSAIEKGIRGDVTDALNCIFRTSDRVKSGELTYTKGLDEVYSHPFFAKALTEDLKDYSQQVSEDEELRQMRQLLNKVKLKRKEAGVLKRAISTVTSSF